MDAATLELGAGSEPGGELCEVFVDVFVENSEALLLYRLVDITPP